MTAAEVRGTLDRGLLRGSVYAEGDRNEGCVSGKQASTRSSLLLCSIFVYKLLLSAPPSL